MIELTTTAAGSDETDSVGSETARLVQVVAVVVTWNRKADVLRVLERLGTIDADGVSLHAIVVDNASDDGTAEAIRDRFGVDRYIEAGETRGTGANRLGIGSLTVVRNAENLGGCGGFNSGFAAVSSLFGEPGAASGPEFVWLLDDDIDLPADALGRLRRAADTDPSIALVGSRTVDLADRRTTIESTIYYDRGTGMMVPEPPGGGGKPRGASEGLCDVDIVSACSMLVQWAAIEGVGFWDERFFIYCDDADWCLRVKRAGWRVVCALDAVVYHTHWTQKLTPTRGYYLHRNLLWMNSKHLDDGALRRVWFGWCRRLLSQSASAALGRRLSDARITARSVSDAMADRGGKLDHTAERCGVIESLERVRALGGSVAVIAGDRAGLDIAERFRAEVANALIAAGRSAEMPRWRVLLSTRARAPRHGGEPPMGGRRRVGVVWYRPSVLGVALLQMRFVGRRPAAVVVIEGHGGPPMAFGRSTLRVTPGSMSDVQIERWGIGPLVGFACLWGRTAFGSVLKGLTIRRDARSDPVASR